MSGPEPDTTPKADPTGHKHEKSKLLNEQNPTYTWQDDLIGWI